MAMNDDLLKRADRAMRENQFIREQCLGNLMQAKAAGARIKRMVQWATADTANARHLGLEAAGRVVSNLENHEANKASGTSDKT